MSEVIRKVYEVIRKVKELIRNVKEVTRKLYEFIRKVTVNATMATECTRNVKVSALKLFFENRSVTD